MTDILVERETQVLVESADGGIIETREREVEIVIETPSTGVLLEQSRRETLVLREEADGVLLEQPERAVEIITDGLQGPPGPRGEQGAEGPEGASGLRVVGAVDTASSLPATAADGDLWVARDTGHGYAWYGVAWVDIGPVALQGPAGERGKDGQIRYTGHGAPGVILGAEPGDTYLDTLSGVVYKLS